MEDEKYVINKATDRIIDRTDAEPFEADSQLCGVTEDNRPEESEDMKMKCPSFYPLGLRLRPQSAPDH